MVKERFYLSTQAVHLKSTNETGSEKQDIEIVDRFRKKETIDKYSYLANYQRSRKTNSTSIPRYVDTFEPETGIDITPLKEKSRRDRG